MTHAASYSKTGFNLQATVARYQSWKKNPRSSFYCTHLYVKCSKIVAARAPPRPRWGAYQAPASPDPPSRWGERKVKVGRRMKGMEEAELGRVCFTWFRGGVAAEPTRPTGPGGIRRPEESTLTQNFRRIATRSVSRSEQCSSTTKWTKNGDLWIISDRRGLPAGGPRRQPRTVEGGWRRWPRQMVGQEKTECFEGRTAAQAL